TPTEPPRGSPGTRRAGRARSRRSGRRRRACSSLCCTRGGWACLPLEDRVVQRHLDRRADDEADADHRDREADQSLLLAAHDRRDQREDQRRRRDPERPVHKLEETEEDRRRSEEPRHGFDRADRFTAGRGHTLTLARDARAASRASRVPCGPPRRGRGPVLRRQGRQIEYSFGSTPGSGSALIAYQTTNARYAIGIFSTSIMKRISQPVLDIRKV